MSLKPSVIQPIPAETARVARAAFPQGNMYMQMRDELGPIYHDETFAPLFSQRGQPAEAPWRLALVTVMQFVEDLPDRQAADAVRGRIDWKYALGLELTDPGFDFSVLCEFRARLLAGAQEHILLEALLDQCKRKGLLKAAGKQRSDSTYVLAAIRALNRLECGGETLRAALNSVAVVAPDWLGQRVTPAWFDRYTLPFVHDRLPKTEEERQALADTIGRDGFQLLTAVDAPDAPHWLREIPAVRVLRWVWIQQYYVCEDIIQCRDPKDLPPCAQRIHSPYDTDARYSSKRTTVWTGYKVHLTETCADDGPFLMTDVQTTPGTTADKTITNTIHQTLAQRNLLPQEHLLDAGYLDAELLVNSVREYGMDLVGPVPEDASWQKQVGQGYDVAAFAIEWERHTVRCPAGKTSREWKPTHSAYGLPVIHIEFDKRDCLVCPARPSCTRSKSGAREMTIRPQAQHVALQAARQRQVTLEFKQRYAKRAGVEGTHAQGVSICGLRHARYRGLPKTRLQHLATAAAINLVRFWAWETGVPRAQTRQSRFAGLQKHVA